MTKKEILDGIQVLLDLLKFIEGKETQIVEEKTYEKINILVQML